MSSTRLFRRSFPSAALLAVAAAFLLGGRATAQPPRAVYIPPDVKGFQAQRMLQQAAQQQVPAGPRVTRTFGTASVRPAATPTPPIQVTLTFPNVPDTAFVAIRGPDGEVRYFPVEGGREGVRVIVVHPGEHVRIQLPPANPR